MEWIRKNLGPQFIGIGELVVSENYAIIDLLLAMLIVRKVGNHFRAIVFVVYSPYGKGNVLSIDLLC